MLRKWEDIQRDLAAPFPASEIEWRIAQAGAKDTGAVWCKVLAYITARAIDDRLDEAAGGCENWEVHYRHEAEAALCGITIRGLDENGEIRSATKWDGADRTDIEAVKGGISGAKKRAGVPWGIGRYLYRLDEGWAITSLNKERGPEWRWAPAHTDQKNPRKSYPSFYWRAPDLPEWALPAGERAHKTRKEPERPEAGEAPAPVTAAEQAAANNEYGIPFDSFLILDAAKSVEELTKACGDMKDAARGQNPAGVVWTQGLYSFYRDRKSFLDDLTREVLGDE